MGVPARPDVESSDPRGVIVEGRFEKVRLRPLRRFQELKDKIDQAFKKNKDKLLARGREGSELTPIQPVI